MLSTIYWVEIYDIYFLSKLNTELHWTSTCLEAEFGLSFLLLLHLSEWSQQQKMWAFLAGEVQEDI